MIVTNIQHFLDEDGKIATQLNDAEIKYIEKLGTMISGVTSAGDYYGAQKVRCIKPLCDGLLNYSLNDESLNIEWRCPTCKTSGVITGWEGTFWDCFVRDVVWAH